MAIWTLYFLSFIICQRLIELIIAKRNERWLKKIGGVEKGKSHYKWFIVIHVLFFMSLLIEINYFQPKIQQINIYLFSLFIITQIGRLWCIHALGKFWNTKIIVLSGSSLVKKGPYRFIKHPNYLIVAVELVVIPLLLGAYITAIIFPMLHILILKIRIPAEDRALAEASIVHLIK